MCCTVDVASASICIAINWADEGAYEAITNSGVKVQSLSGKDLCECEANVWSHAVQKCCTELSSRTCP